MNKINKIKLINQNTINFDELDQTTKDIIHNLIDEHQNLIKPEGYKSSEDCFDDIEFVRRDGFIPNSYNKGGILWRNFTTLEAYWGSGYEPKNKDANKEIQRQIEVNEEFALNEFQQKYPNEKPDIDNDNYYEILREYLNADDLSIMHEIRFMYHGFDNKKHTASVSVALNTEGPYHRSHISWAPKVFCEAAKEIEISWSTNTELKNKLDKLLKKLIKEMF